MKIGQLVELLKGFNLENEIKIAGWVENQRADRGFSYVAKSLGSDNITVEQVLNSDSVAVVFGIDL